MQYCYYCINVLLVLLDCRKLVRSHDEEAEEAESDVQCVTKVIVLFAL